MIITNMISCLQHEIEAIGEGVLNVEPSFVKSNLSLVVVHQEALKKWRILENSLRVAQHNNHLRLFYKNVNISHLIILFFLKSVRILCMKPIQAKFHIMEWMLPKIRSMRKDGLHDLPTMESRKNILQNFAFNVLCALQRNFQAQ